jgi:multicomponent Na+:H+ antiporter subunit B
MNTVIFRTLSPVVTGLILVFAVFVTLRGHNEPGGGFIGGLIATSGFAIYGLSHGVARVRQALWVHPMVYSGFGLALAGGAGVLSAPFGRHFLTGLWTSVDVLGVEVALSTPLFFDLGVFFVVTGTITSVALALEEREGGV